MEPDKLASVNERLKREGRAPTDLFVEMATTLFRENKALTQQLADWKEAGFEPGGLINLHFALIQRAKRIPLPVFNNLDSIDKTLDALSALETGTIEAQLQDILTAHVLTEWCDRYKELCR